MCGEITKLKGPIEVGPSHIRDWGLLVNPGTFWEVITMVLGLLEQAVVLMFPLGFSLTGVGRWGRWR